MDVEIKPCPICGRDAILEENGGQSRYRVRCEYCIPAMNPITCYARSRENAIKKWNRYSDKNLWREVKRLCMMCEKKPSEFTNVEFKKDNGEIIPVTIDGEKCNSLDLCLDCLIATQVMIAKSKISEINARSVHE